MSELDNLDILDATLDDLADLPSYEPFPAGHHRVKVTLESEKISERMKAPYVEMVLEAVETIELVDADASKPTNPGDKCSTLFNLGNEFGLGNLKKCCKPLAAALGTESIRECVEQCNDIECEVITSISIGKTDGKPDPDKKYLNIKELQVA